VKYLDFGDGRVWTLAGDVDMFNLTNELVQGHRVVKVSLNNGATLLVRAEIIDAIEVGETEGQEPVLD
jgi:hypothetical protein